MIIIIYCPSGSLWVEIQAEYSRGGLLLLCNVSVPARRLTGRSHLKACPSHVWGLAGVMARTPTLGFCISPSHPHNVLTSKDKGPERERGRQEERERRRERRWAGRKPYCLPWISLRRSLGSHAASLLPHPIGQGGYKDSPGSRRGNQEDCRSCGMGYILVKSLWKMVSLENHSLWHGRPFTSHLPFQHYFLLFLATLSTLLKLTVLFSFFFFEHVKFSMRPHPCICHSLYLECPSFSMLTL